MGAIGKPVPQPELSERVWQGTVALSDRKRTAPRIVRPGDGRRTHCASTAPSSVGQHGRVSARCDSQPEDLLRRDDVDAQMQQTSQVFSLSSGDGVVVCPGGGFVVERASFEAAVDDADEPVRELTESGLVADVAGSKCVVVGAGSR